MKQRATLTSRVLIVAALSMVASAARAQATLGNLMTTASTNTYNGPGLVLSVASYIIGATLIVWSLVKLRAVVDGKVSITDPVWRMTGGAAMMVLPWIVNVATNTLFGSSTNGTEGIYNNLQTGDCTQGLDQCMMALVQNIYQPTQVLINVVCYIVGGVCVGIGVYRLALAGQGAAGAAPKASGTIGYIAGGALLISLGQFVDVVRNSIFGDTGTSAVFTTLSFNGQNGLPQQLQTDANNVFMALFAWVELIGYLAFARGVYLLIKIAQGDGSKSHGQAFTHIVGGALAVNMYPLVEAIQSTLGISLVT